MKNIVEPARQTPVAKECDVVVAGGGPAGVAAAISAAREGASTVLLEAAGELGGMLTSGLLCYILDFANKDGIMAEIMAELDKRNALLGKAYDPEQMKLLLEDMCTKAGVILQYHTRVVDVCRDDRITHVIAESKSGRQAWGAKIVIDATGDGDVGALAGCQFEVGRPGSNEMQPMSLEALVTGIDFEEARKYIMNSGGVGNTAKSSFRAEMNKAGVDPSYGAPMLVHLREGLYQLALNHEYGKSGMNAHDVTQATVHARAEIFNVVNALRSLGGIWENLRIVATGSYIGVREGRRLSGLYEVSVDDAINGKKHDDAVCEVTFNVDVHSTDPTQGKTYGAEGHRTVPYQIPIRALISKDVRGLMMAGRCISGDFHAHASYRVVGNVVCMGEVAGRVAAQSAKNNTLPQDIY